MAWSNTYDTATPDGDTNPGSVLDDHVQTIKKAIQERLDGNDLYFPLTGTQVSSTDAGKHRKVVFKGLLTVKPTVGTDEVAIYSKEVSGKWELFFENEDGTELQLTTGGLFNISGSTIPDDTVDDGAIKLANNGYLIASNQAGDDDVELIKANTSDLPALGEGAQTYDSSAPTEDAQIANKKYVDDTIPQVTKTTTQAIIVHAGGLIEQWFRVTSTVDGVESFTFPQTFDTACIGVVLSHAIMGISITSPTLSGFQLNRDDAIDGSVTVYVHAVGY